MDKFRFLHDILSSQVLRPKERQRLVKLIGDEFLGSNLSQKVDIITNRGKNTGVSNSYCNDSRLELSSTLQLLDSEANSSKGDLTVFGKSDMPQYRDPKNLRDFLYEFNQDPVLKTTCHDMDSDDLEVINDYCGIKSYNLEAHYKLIVSNYNSLTARYRSKGVNRNVLGLISAYLGIQNSKTRWSEENIEMNWRTKGMVEWAKNHPNFPPHANSSLIESRRREGFRIVKPIVIEKQNRIIRDFRELVIYFKHMFHIRQDNSLCSLLARVNNTYKSEIKIDLSEVASNLELFTYVDAIKQVYVKILNMIVEASKQQEGAMMPEVIVSSLVTSDGKNVILSVNHVNSVYGKPIENTVNRLGKDYTSLILKQINGLCDFYLEADFGSSHYAKVNVWNGKKRTSQTVSKRLGVEHILVFPN